MEMIFAKNFARNCEKNKSWTSDAWLLVLLYKRTSVQAYYIIGIHKIDAWKKSWICKDHELWNHEMWGPPVPQKNF